METSEHTKLAIDIFNDVLEQDLKDRDQYLHKRCGKNNQLFLEVQDLLDHHQRQPKGFLFNNLNFKIDRNRTGDTIGSYKIVSHLGSGGTADVYLAERIDGIYSGKVAIKIIRKDKLIPNIVARFQSERELLSSLSHSNIAKLFDGGTTDDGIPYYVMEYIEGLNIVEFCREKSLDINQKLSLFVKVCSAVSYAHKNLIIHRDIKPSNIIVDQDGEPKLLDFGIAKLLTSEVGQKNNYETAINQILLTLEYASPEQTRGERLTVSTDIFSLGTLLYQIIFDRLPYENELKLDRAQKCQELSPLKPERNSSNISFSSHHKISRDLTLITFKAIQFSPDYRYSSVLNLSEDIERFLNSKPIMARNESFIYSLFKVIQRNKLTSSITTVLALLLISVGAIQQNRVIKERDLARLERDNATIERDKLAQTQNFLLDIFESSDPDTSNGNNITAREILSNGALKLENSLNDQAGVRYELVLTIAKVYEKLGLYDESEIFLNKYISEINQLGLNSHAYAHRLQHMMGIILTKKSLYDEAETYLMNALIGHQSSINNAPTESALVLGDLASLYKHTGSYSKALEALLQALDIELSIYGKNSEKLIKRYVNIGVVYTDLAEYGDAIEYLESAVSISKALGLEDSLALCDAYNGFGLVHWGLGDYGEARKYFNLDLELSTKLLGPDHPNLSQTHNNLGLVSEISGDYDQALKHYFKSLAIKKSSFGELHSSFVPTLMNIGITYKELEDYELAIEYYEKASQISKSTLGDNHLWNALAYNNLGEAYMLQSRYQLALDHYSKAKAIAISVVGDDHPRVAEILMSIGSLYLKINDYKKALEHLEIADQIYSQKVSNENIDAVKVKRLIGQITDRS